MFNPDMKNEKITEIQNKMAAAIQGGNTEDFCNAQAELANVIADNVKAEADFLVQNGISDMQALSSRGINPLTAEEKEYYNLVTEAIAGGNGLADVKKAMPMTIISRVFDEAVEKSELLKLIRTENVTGIKTGFLKRKNGAVTAFWGALSSKVSEVLDEGFEIISLEQCKLSAFIPVSQDMLKLGPTWLDRYVVKFLSETIYAALENAVISGDGKDKPIGMIMDMSTNSGGTYSPKSATPLNALTPDDFGEKIMAPLTKDGTKKIENLIIVLNPLDYCKKLFALTTFQTANGNFVNDKLPYPAKIVQSTAMPKNKMVVGNPKDYYLPMAMPQKIEKSDDARFVEDQRLYKIKMYASGSPEDNESFCVFDITGLGSKSLPASDSPAK